MLRIFFAVLAVLSAASSADARHYRRHYHHVYAHHHYRNYQIAARPVYRTGGGLVTVPTAAGISITVAPAHAEKFVGFIADIVAAGYRPRDIGCYAQRSRGGAHPLGAACDFDQRARNSTAAFMYHIREIASRHGLRDGCSFGDCGHIEDGSRVYVLNGGYRHYAGVRQRRYAMWW